MKTKNIQSEIRRSPFFVVASRRGFIATVDARGDFTWTDNILHAFRYDYLDEALALARVVPGAVLLQTLSVREVPND
jgi:hypothetical protein